MDEGIQATETPDSIRDEDLCGGTEESCSCPTGKKGRPKKLRPPTPLLARELAVTLRHFFPELSSWLGDIQDPRNPRYAVFSLKLLLLLGVLMFLCHSGSRNHFNDQLGDATELAKTLARLLGIEVGVLPHLDTLDKVLRRLDSTHLESFQVRLIRRLIRMKALDDWRIGGRFLVAIDATGLYSFPKRHCEHCIEKQHPGGTVSYSHQVLVAFLVSTDGYALPIACEFIENPGPIYDKQDCETKAFHRLEPRLKAFFPQTPFTLLLDALYADQNVMRPTIRNNWNFFTTFLDTDMPSLWTEVHALSALTPGQHATLMFPEDQGSQEVRWVNDVEYQGMTLSAIFQEDKDKDGNTIQRFAHLTVRRIDPATVWSAAAAARCRWRCENEGFNVLKNGGFGLEHVYSRKPTASKSYVFLMLIAHTVQQLLTRGRLGTVFKDAFNTFLTYGERLLEALRNQSLPLDLDMPGQIRLSTA